MSEPSPQARLASFVFGSPVLYRIKRFVIETLIWRVVLSGLFRLEPHAMPDLAPVYGGRRVLLAACGPGTALTGPPLADTATVFAFDLSWKFVAACTRSRPRWRVYAGDVLHLPHRGQSFDVAVAYSVLHHIADDARVILAELARVSTERIVVVEGVVPPSGWLRHALLLWYRLVDGGYRYYTRDQLLATIRNLGLQVESEGLHGPIQHMWLGVIRARAATP
jgi:SAM-dependent methyltransferase